MTGTRFAEIQREYDYWNGPTHYDLNWCSPMVDAIGDLIEALTMANDNYADLLDRHEQLLRSKI